MQVDGTVIGTVRWQRRSLGLTEHFLEVVVFWRHPDQVWKWEQTVAGWLASGKIDGRMCSTPGWPLYTSLCGVMAAEPGVPEDDGYPWRRQDVELNGLKVVSGQEQMDGRSGVGDSPE